MDSKYSLIDGEQRNRDNPGTFSIPDLDDRTALAEGSYVKIGVETDADLPGERFWVLVTEQVDGRYKGRVNNDLVYTELHGLKDEDVVEFGSENVLMVEPPEPMLKP